MHDLLEKLKKQLEETNSSKKIEEIKEEYFGKKGYVKTLLKKLKELPVEEKRLQGPKIQQIQKTAQSLILEKEKVLKEKKLDIKLKEQAEELDFNLPKIGHLHPITQTIREMNALFESMGFSIMDGPEIEEDKYCFQRLNVPMDHPARDMQDTIYIEEPDYLLRTQASSIESRAIEKYDPPFKIVSPARVYRNEKVNKSNHFIFHHYQGVVLSKDISLKDLFSTFNVLFKKMYGENVKVRYRNKYYPEVEPGVGPDMQCFQCKGKGCPLCKGVGWIEMGGAGIIHPNILRMAGKNPKKWRGFAFGLGLDRWVMAKYKISDIRTLLGGNLGYKYYENENTL